MDRVNKLSHHLSSMKPPSLEMQKCSGEEPLCYSEVLEGGVALITLNRPKSLNALTLDMQIGYLAALREAGNDPNVKVIVVTGKGRGFCVGAELKAPQGPQKGDSEGAKEKKRARKLDSADLNWWESFSIPKPIIAAINGPCAGLGLVLASMCDIRFTVKDAKFTSAFAKRGLVAELGISYILPRIVGVSNALDILMSSRVFLGEEAKQMGLVSKVYDDKETLMRETLHYAREMGNKCSPASLAEMKTQIYRDLHKDPDDAGLYSQNLMRKSFYHPDFKEGVSSFVKKRDPKFQGLSFGRIEDL